MKKTKFDLLVENILTVATEGRKPKQYTKMVIDFDKLESDIAKLADDNVFKGLYTKAINGLKEYAPDQYFSNGEMASEAKTLPEWEQSIFIAFTGSGISKAQKQQFAERFFNFLKDPDRDYFSEYVPEPEGGSKIESIADHILTYIKGADNESATKDEIVTYINRYGHDADETRTVLDKMVAEGDLVETDGQYTAAATRELDTIEPSDKDLGSRENPDEVLPDTEELDSDYTENDLRELGIDPNDPFREKDFYDDNLNADYEQ